MTGMAFATGMMLTVLASFEQPSNARDIFSAAIQAEQSRASGKATILVEPVGREHGYPISPDAPEDPDKPTRLEVLWKNAALFRIEVWQEDTLVRTITSDGAFIDTGNDMLWDMSYLTWSSGASEAATTEFFELMWPRDVFGEFFFPIASGSVTFPYQAFYFNPQISIYVKSPSETQGLCNEDNVHLVAALSQGIHYEFVVDPAHGHCVLRFDHVLDGQTLSSHEYSSPFQTSDGHWMPAEFKYTLNDLEGKTVLSYTASLIQEQVTFSDDSAAADFALPKTEYPVVNRKNPTGMYISEVSDFIEDLTYDLEFPGLVALFIAVPLLLILVYLLQFLLPRGKRE